MKQTVRVRVEVGPGMPREVGPFHQSPALEAVLTALFRVLTAENVYMDPADPAAEFVATKGGVTARLVPTHMGAGIDPKGGGLPTTHYIYCEAEVTIEGDIPDRDD